MFVKGNRISKKTLVLIASGILILAMAVGGVLAYLVAKTAPVTNDFTPAEVSCEVVETFEENIKRDVKIQNTGNTDAFLRTVVVVNWVSESGNGKILSTAPVEGVDYQVTWGSDSWVQGTDGFWYFTKPVAPQDLTANLIDTASLNSEAPEGYQLHIRILASAIQSSPEYVVEQAWNVSVQHGELVVN